MLFHLSFSEDSDTLEEDIDIKNEPLDGKDPLYDCPHCGQVFSNFAEVEGHIITEHKGHLISKCPFGVFKSPKKSRNLF